MLPWREPSGASPRLREPEGASGSVWEFLIQSKLQKGSRSFGDLQRAPGFLSKQLGFFFAVSIAVLLEARVKYTDTRR